MVLLNHDTVIVKNNSECWLKNQVENSRNFLLDNKLLTIIFGSMNYQIEHCLFPNICYLHYSKISPIVREFCIKNDIKYKEYRSLYNVFVDLILNLKKISV